MQSISTRTLEEATGISEQEASQLWVKMNESPFRKLIQYEIEIAQARARLAIDTCVSTEVSKHQGIVLGMTTCLGILARHDPKPSSR